MRGAAHGKSDEMIEPEKEQRFDDGSRDPRAKASDEEADGVAGCVIFPNSPTLFFPSFRDQSVLGLSEQSVELLGDPRRPRSSEIPER